MAAIFENLSPEGDYKVQYSQREDGQWFTRRSNPKGPYGYTWGSWTECSGKPEEATLTSGKSKLPYNLFSERALAKQRLREKDEQDLASGKKTREQLQKENGVFTFPNAKIWFDDPENLF